MSSLISCEESILSKRARSTLRILPLSGRIAWLRRSRPCFAEPPALSPSTIKSSLLAGSRSWQSASLPGRFEMSNAPLRRVRSRALPRASRSAETGEMGAAVALRDGVGKAQHRLVIGIRPLHRDFEKNAVALATDRQRRRMQGLFRAVEVTDKGFEPALIVKGRGPRLGLAQ